MKPSAATMVSPQTASRGQTAAAVGVLCLAALAAYHNCFRVPFLFDEDEVRATSATNRHSFVTFLPPDGQRLEAKELCILGEIDDLG
jgi:hypothetical protein